MASFVTVFFEDHSEKKFAITEETTVAQLIQKIATKLDLRNDVESFGIYEVIGTQEAERFLKPEDRCAFQPGAKVLFKKRYFFFKHRDDENWVDLVYKQMREDVLRGNYCCSDQEVYTLGAISMREAFGPPDPQKHKAGFLIQSGQIQRFVPAPLFKSRKPEEWEKKILQEYQWLTETFGRAIPDAFRAKLKYLDELERLKPDIFGSVFFPAWELEIQDKLVKERVKVTLAISKYGIVTFRHMNKTVRQKRHAHPFQEILGWAVHAPSMTFVYTVQDHDQEQRFTFESELADEIPLVCGTYVNLIMKNDPALATLGAPADGAAAPAAPTPDAAPAAPAPADAAPAAAPAPADAAPAPAPTA